jgi:filamentous hemagglutinin family protein
MLPLATASLAVIAQTKPVWAQSIQPTSDPTGPTVLQNGNRYDITGGVTSDGGRNLFQSFQRFGLNTGEIANFIADPGVRNILSRVVGGDPSIINGLIQVTGGNPNLYLVNPAGILFGPNASLNVPAAFTATTANGVGFGDQWFNAIGDNNYEALVGDPTQFAFTMSQPGAIANLGNLAVNPSQSLTLIGGTVLNTGTLTAPGGSITIAAVPGQSLVRLSQSGHLLGLEIQTIADSSTPDLGSVVTPLPFTPQTLPSLLTGGSIDGANQITVNPDGSIQLTGSSVSLQATPGTAIVMGTGPTPDAIAPARLDVSSTDPIPAGSPPPQINLLGDRLAVVAANLDASGSDGGTIRIGGDLLGQASVPSASRTLVDSNTVITANSLSTTGNGGNVVIQGDRAVRVSGQINANGGETGGNGGSVQLSGQSPGSQIIFDGQISAHGGTTGGNGGSVQVSGSQLRFDGSVDIVTNAGQLGTLGLQADNITIDNSPDSSPTLPDIFQDDFTGVNFTIQAGRLASQTANVRIAATNNINVSLLPGTDLTFAPSGGTINLIADADGDRAGNFFMNQSQSIIAPGRALTLGGASLTVGAIDTRPDPEASGTNGGAVTLDATNGSILASQILTNTQNGAAGGAIALTATGDITTGVLNTSSASSIGNAANGGAVSLQSATGNITLNGQLDTNFMAIDTSSTATAGTAANAGNVTLNAATGGISGVGNINASANAATTSGNGGTISLSAGTDISLTGSLNASASGAGGNGGPISLAAGNGISLIGLLNTSASGVNGNGGLISLSAGTGISLTGAVNASASGASGNGGTVSLNTTNGDISLFNGSIDIPGSNDGIDTHSQSGDAGDIKLSILNTGNIQIDGSLRAFVNSIGSAGDGGAIALSTLSGNITIGGGVQSFSHGSGSAGDAGAIAVSTGKGNIQVGGGVQAYSLAEGGAASDGGSVTLNASGTLNILDLLDTSSQTLAADADAGTGGNVNLTAGGTITLADSGINASSQAGGSGGNAGNGGNLRLTSTSGDILTGGLLTFSAVNGAIGNAAQGGDITLSAANGSVTVSNSSGVTSSSPIITQSIVGPTGQGTGNAGNAGTVTITAGNSITIKSSIFASSTTGTGTAGNGGRIQLTTANDIDLSGGLTAYSQTNLGTAGDGGAIALTAQNGFVRVPSSIWTYTHSASGGDTGSGGAIRINAAGDININSNGNTNLGSMNTSSVSGSGNARAGGTIALTTTNGYIRAADGILSYVQSQTGNVGDAGNITFTANDGITVDASTGSALGINASNTASNGNAGQAGAITLITANNDITLNTLLSATASGAAGTGTGGAIRLRTEAGGITVGPLQLGSSTGSSNPLTADATGTIDFSAGLTLSGASLRLGDTIQPENVLLPTQVDTQGGSIRLNQIGDLNFATQVTTRGGNLRLTTAGDLTISSNLVTDGGSIVLNGARVNTRAGELDSSSITGDSGNITIEAARALVTGNLNASNSRPGLTGMTSGNGGTITLSSNQGTIDTSAGTLDTSADLGNGGTITLTAPGGITVANLNTSVSNTGNAGGISLTSNQGGIDTRAGALSSTAVTGNGGSITLQAQGDITTNDILSSAFGTATRANSGARAGDISLTSSNGGIRTGDLDASGTRMGGAIALTANNDSITTAILDASSDLNGGSILLNAGNNITIDSITTEGGTNGNGGNVRITAGGLFRAGGVFAARNGLQASISAVGGLSGGDITLEHGGNGSIPFTVGDASQNGTAGSITSGTSTITSSPTQAFKFTTTQGNITIRTNGVPSSCPTGNCDPRAGSNSTPSPTPNNSPTVTPTPAPAPTPEHSGTPGKEAEPVAGSIDTGEVHPPSLPPEVFQPKDLGQVREELLSAQSQAKVKTALVYIGFTSAERPNGLDFSQRESAATQEFERYFHSQSAPSAVGTNQASNLNDEDQLEVMIVTGSGDPIRKRISGVTRGMVRAVASQFRNEVTNPLRIRSDDYLEPAQQLYRWLITPLEHDLQDQHIQNLTFIMDAGLRSLPVAALHDGKQFLIEKYSVNLVPSISLIDTQYVNLKNVQVLAMGASQFTDQAPLPAVPVELKTITQSLWNGELFLNNAFTLANLKSQREHGRFGIVHLATHAEFRPGQPSNSFIQFWDQKLELDQLGQLNLYNPPVELLVLSACRTALGDEQAELGFAGLALQAGVKSALASLWYVSDEGSLAFMTEFYRQLRTAPTKAEALRQAQLAMLRGEVRVEGGKLRGSRGEAIALPSELSDRGSMNLSHPFFWSAFTLVGSPW